MLLYPEKVEEKLGFDVLRQRLHAQLRSSLGEDRLREMSPSDSLTWVQAELERVAGLQDAFRFDDPVPLDPMLDVRTVLARALPDEAFVPVEDLLAVKMVSITMRRLKRYFELRKDKYPRLAQSVETIVPLENLERHIDGILDAEGEIRDDASPELQRLRRLILRRRGDLREALMQALRKATAQGYATEEQPTIRSGRMVIPVRAEAQRKVEGFVHDTSSSGQTVYLEPAACLHLNNEVRTLEGEEHREVERILRQATTLIRHHAGDLRANLRVLAQFDLWQAKARLANHLDATIPQLNDEGILRIYQGRNPVLHLFFQRQPEPRTVVPLDLTLGDDYRTLVITGPNAGGKTVAMKTVGLLALMLSYGLPLPVASTSSLSLFDRLIVDIGDEQSMEDDLSTFSSHVTHLNHMLEQATDRTLVLIDEAGTGTDPEEGGALAQAVLERLTRLGARTVATTHHGSLKVFAHETDQVENGSMAFDQQTLSPTYRFQARIPGSSYAFEIAHRIGLDTAVLDRARTLVGEQKAALEDLLATFESRNQELAQRLAEAEKTLQKAQHEKTDYETRLARIRQDRDHLRQQALEEAERIVQGANAQVERTIREIKEAQAEKEATQVARTVLESYKQDLTRQHEKVQRRQQAAPAVPSEKPSKRRPARTEQPKTQGGVLQAGDQVILDNNTTPGEILEITDSEAMVALGSMRLRVRLNRLTKVGGPRKQQVTVRQLQQSPSVLPSSTARMHLDLRGSRVEEALPQVERFLDEAIAANLNKVEILHGKGTGALRQAIHEYLSAAPNVAHFEDAPWNQGGAGITWVSLK